MLDLDSDFDEKFFQPTFWGKVRSALLPLVLFIGGCVFLAWLVRPSHAQTRVTFATGQVSVANTATSILAGDPQRTNVLITNAGTVAVYIGNSAVTTANGAYLPAGTSISIPTKDAVFGISSGATQTVTFLVTYGGSF